MPKVSVIIPVYNAEYYLRECLDSVIRQSLQDIEIICIDDGSTDRSLDILSEYAQNDNRITILTQQNKFAGVARNYGMEHASGKYLVFLDSDDFFEPTMLEEEYLKCEEFQADICLCGSNDFNNVTKQFSCPNTRINDALFSTPVVNKELLCEHIFRLTTACPWNKMFRAEFIKAHNLHFQALPRANDLYFVLCALFLAERIVGVNKIFVHYRVENSESLQSGNRHTPGIFLKALDGVYERLNITNALPQYQKAFANIATEHIAYNLRKLDSEYTRASFNQLKDCIVEEYLSKYDISNHPVEYFHNTNNIGYLVEKNILPQEVFGVTKEPYIFRFFPRKIRGFLVCCQTRGIGYTLKYSVQKVVSKFSRKSAAPDTQTTEAVSVVEKEPVTK